MKKELNIVTNKLNIELAIQSKDLTTNAVMTDMPEFNNLLHLFVMEFETALLKFEEEHQETINQIGK